MKRGFCAYYHHHFTFSMLARARRRSSRCRTSSRHSITANTSICPSGHGDLRPAIGGASIIKSSCLCSISIPRSDGLCVVISLCEGFADLYRPLPVMMVRAFNGYPRRDELAPSASPPRRATCPTRKRAAQRRVQHAQHCRQLRHLPRARWWRFSRARRADGLQRFVTAAAAVVVIGGGRRTCPRSITGKNKKCNNKNLMEETT